MCVSMCASVCVCEEGMIQGKREKKVKIKSK